MSADPDEVRRIVERAKLTEKVINVAKAGNAIPNFRESTETLVAVGLNDENITDIVSASPTAEVAAKVISDLSHDVGAASDIFALPAPQRMSALTRRADAATTPKPAPVPKPATPELHDGMGDAEWSRTFKKTRGW